jgi:hypothetical protein
MGFREMLHDFCGWMGWYRSSRYADNNQFQYLVWSYFDDIFGGNSGSLVRYLVLPITVSSVYGISHVIVWNHYFPSEVDMWVWRISSIMVPIVACGVLSSMLSIVCGDSVFDIILTLWRFSLILVPLAGVGLLIESFASLRRVPAGVYQTIPLERYWPHF